MAKKIDPKRRIFLKGLAATMIGGALMPLSKAGTALAEGNSETVEVPPLPWPYPEDGLDPEYVRKLAYLGYTAFHCAGGAFWGIMTALREKIGYPYTLIPMPSKEELMEAVEKGEAEKLIVPMEFGLGGALGFGTLCGALNGALLAMNYVLKLGDLKKVGRALIQWYEIFPFPSDKSNEYAKNHEFPVIFKTDKVLPRSVSESPLCHISVSKWCVKSGYGSGSPERIERCARLTADVAARAVELLNAYFKGEFASVASKTQIAPGKEVQVTNSAITASCEKCHHKGTECLFGEFTQGAMRCETCHRDLTPHAHVMYGKLEPSKGIDTSEIKDIVYAGAGLSAVVGALAGIWSYMRSAESEEK